MELYTSYGPDIPFIKFLGVSKPLNLTYDSLYAYAIGYATATVPYMRHDIAGEEVTKNMNYRLARAYAIYAAGEMTKGFVDGLGLENAAITEFTKMHRRLVEDV